MTLTAAFARLEALTITGITNTGISAYPPTQADMPAVVVDFAPDVDFVEQFKSDRINATSGVLAVIFDHCILQSGYGLQNAEVRQHDIITHLDNYFAALKTDMRMNDLLTEPLLAVAIHIGTLQYAATRYYGAVVRHLWKLKY